MDKKYFVKNLITLAMVTIAYIVVSILVSTGNISSLLKGQLIPMCAYIIGALALNLTVGVLGELSLGHAGFMSVGAFGAIVITNALASVISSTALRLVIGILFGAIVAAIFGFLVGMPVLRLQGDYLAIVTLAFGEIIKSIVINLYIGMDANGIHISFVNNRINLLEGGKMLIDGPMGANNTKISTFLAGYILIMIVLVVIFNLVKSKTGRAIMALRENKIAAESIGISITSYKLMAFVISAAIAGMAGALYGLNYTSIVATKFNYNTSILLLVFVVLGGLGNMRGSIISAALLTILPELLRSIKDYRMLAYAILLIVIMLVRNNPTLKELTNNLFKKKKKEVVNND